MKLSYEYSEEGLTLVVSVSKDEAISLAGGQNLVSENTPDRHSNFRVQVTDDAAAKRSAYAEANINNLSIGADRRLEALEGLQNELSAEEYETAKRSIADNLVIGDKLPDEPQLEAAQ